MTTEETEKATREAQPKEGEVLIYIDHTGAKLYGKPEVEHKPKQPKK